MTPPTSLRLNLTQLQKQAKETLKAHRAGDPGACAVLRRLPRLAEAPPAEILAARLVLADVQFALAREHGFESWAHLKRYIEGREPALRGELRRQDGAVWISGVPALGWGLDRDCTFAGALEAALAVSQEPWPYAELMAFTGLAFRVRWSEDFCPSCAVGEMPDECTGLRDCTGWGTPTDTQFGQDSPDRESIRRRLVQSIDAGSPVLAYDESLDLGVVYGYEADGRVLWTTDYHARGQMPLKLPLERLGPMQIYPHKEHPPLPPLERLRYALRRAVGNWGAGLHDGGLPGRGYLYGPSAYAAWLEAIRGFDRVDPGQAARLHHTHQFACMTLANARQAAGRYFNETGTPELTAAVGPRAAKALAGAVAGSMAMAARLYRAMDTEGLFRGPLDQWTPAGRLREAEVLEGIRLADARLHADLAEALAALP